MISRLELTRIAELKHLTIRNTEKDYLLELLLYALSDDRHSLVFKGGTALYKFYNLNRFSEDLDFNLSIKPETFQKQVKKTLKEIDLTGINTYFLKEETFKEVYTCEIEVHGPLYKGTEQT